MKRVVAALLLLGSLSFPADKKRKSPELDVIEVTVRRADGKIGLDGKVKNVSDKPYRAITLIFDFQAAGRQVISSTRAEIDPDPLGPQDEAEFHAQTPDLARAVAVVIRAEDKGEKDLRVDKAGPYPIE